MEYGEIGGQCGTCRFAAEFDYGPGPSGDGDGVHCTSEEHADFLEGQGMEGLKEELKEYGFMDLFRIEALADESYRCPQWQPSDAWLAKK